GGGGGGGRGGWGGAAAALGARAPAAPPSAAARPPPAAPPTSASGWPSRPEVRPGGFFVVATSGLACLPLAGSRQARPLVATGEAPLKPYSPGRQSDFCRDSSDARSCCSASNSTGLTRWSSKP